MLQLSAAALAIDFAKHVEYLVKINYAILQPQVQLAARREISKVKEKFL